MVVLLSMSGSMLANHHLIINTTTDSYLQLAYSPDGVAAATSASKGDAIFE